MRVAWYHRETHGEAERHAISTVVPTVVIDSMGVSGSTYTHVAPIRPS